MNFFRNLITKIRNIRYSVLGGGNRKSLIFGAIYKMTLYQRWKNDQSPLIYVMYSGPMSFVRKSGHYTDGINLNYLDSGDKAWFARAIFLMRKGNQAMNGVLFYRFLKMNRPNIIRRAYRRYHTQLINNPRMVSAGITSLDKLVYPYNDPYIKFINETIQPGELRATGVQVAFSPTELMERVSMAQNAAPIHQMRQQSGSIGRTATWANNAPWLKGK